MDCKNCEYRDANGCTVYFCPFPESIEEPTTERCPVCGRTIAINTDCGHCVRINIQAGGDAASERQWIRDFLAAS